MLVNVSQSSHNTFEHLHHWVGTKIIFNSGQSLIAFFNQVMNLVSMPLVFGEYAGCCHVFFNSHFDRILKHFNTAFQHGRHYCHAGKRQVNSGNRPHQIKLRLDHRPKLTNNNCEYFGFHVLGVGIVLKPTLQNTTHGHHMVVHFSYRQLKDPDYCKRSVSTFNGFQYPRHEYSQENCKNTGKSLNPSCPINSVFHGLCIVLLKVFPLNTIGGTRCS